MTKLVKSINSISLNNKNISNELFSEIFNPTLDLSIDYSEIFLDDLINNDVLKEIPIVKSIVGIIKSGISINQFWFAKKLLIFIQDFNNHIIDFDKIKQFREKIETDKNFGKKIAEKLMIFIDRNIEINQTKIICNLFKAFINENISFEQLNHILIALDNLNPKAFAFFFDLEKIDFTINEDNHDRIGVRNFEMEALVFNSGFGIETSSWFSGLELTEDGKNLFEYGLKPLDKSSYNQ